MPPYTNGFLVAYGCLVGVRTTVLEQPHVCSRACAAPNGIRRGPPAPPLAAHAGVTGVQRPVRGGGAGPARGCGARSPAKALGRPGPGLNPRVPGAQPR
jgi:hypothetical protein